MAWSAMWAAGIVGAAVLGFGLWHAFSPLAEARIHSSAAMFTLLEAGNGLQANIGRTVRPAIDRTQTLAKSPELIDALASGDSVRQTVLLNSKITTATEIDAIALFNTDGHITAINTCYATGQPIPTARIDRVLGGDFTKAPIIQRCLSNASAMPTLEFQTQCDITPAFFDSTGLSVAYSVPVINPVDGVKLGVVSSRLRFERLTDLIEHQTIAGGAAKAYFITDAGVYFSEAINSGRKPAPIPVSELRKIVQSGPRDATVNPVVKRADQYLTFYPLKGFQTLDGGGIHVLIVAEGSWVTQGPRRERIVQAAGVGLIGTLLLIVAGFVHGGLAARRSRRAIEKANESNLRLAAIVGASTEAIISDRLDGTIETWNQGAEKIFGYSADEAIGRTSAILEPHDRRGEIAQLRQAVLNGTPVEQFETRRLCKDGRQVDISLSLSLLRNHDGEVAGISRVARDITAQKLVERELRDTHDQLAAAHSKLVDNARQAGMAEVATGVLHNVGNVLNSVNVSSTLIGNGLRKLRIHGLTKVAALLDERRADLSAFVSSDSRGKMLPEFLSQLASHLATEQSALLKEIDHLHKNVEHIKEIVNAQQAHATSTGLVEPVDLQELIEAALRINFASLTRHEISVVRDFQDVPPVMADKHKVLQILVNLITNARQAINEVPDKTLIVRLHAPTESAVHISIRDTGCGIKPENMTQIFAHGFTTKKDGHGFGLHSSALAAKEMDGALTAHSDGPGSGATFTLELPRPVVSLARAA